MRTFLAAVLGSLTIALGGCADTPTTPAGTDAQKLSAPVKTAKAAIQEAYSLIAAAASVVKQNVDGGIWTKAEGRGYVEKLDDLKKQTDDADAMVRAGSSSADSQSALVNRLVIALHKEISARARTK